MTGRSTGTCNSPEHHNVVLRRRIVVVEAERIRVGKERNIAPAELAVRSGQMEIPAKLLTDRVHENRVLVFGKLIHSLRPKRNGETDEQDGFNQHDGKFQMRGNAALHAFVIGDRMLAFAEAQEHVNEENRPTDKERAHEPMAELDDVIDLVAVLGSIRRQARSVR